MNTAWTKGLPKGSEKDKDVRAAFKESLLIRKRLVEILEDKYLQAAKDRLSADEYESPGWAHRQADAIGYARALKEITAILEEK